MKLFYVPTVELDDFAIEDEDDLINFIVLKISCYKDLSVSIKSEYKNKIQNNNRNIFSRYVFGRRAYKSLTNISGSK
jgi:hypothetical protein